MLQELRVVAHLRHLSVSKHNDEVRLRQEADAMGDQHPSLWRRQQALSCSILRHTPNHGYRAMGQTRGVIGQAYPQLTPHQPEPAQHLWGVPPYGFPQIISCFSGSYISRSPPTPPICSPPGPNFIFCFHSLVASPCLPAHLLVQSLGRKYV